MSRFVLIIIVAFVSVCFADRSYPCCGSHDEETGCAAESRFSCRWLQADDPIYADSDEAAQARRCSFLGCESRVGDVCVSSRTYNCAMDKTCFYSPLVAAGEVCSLATCSETDQQYNIQFIMSGAVGERNYQLAVDFIQEMIETSIAPDSWLSVFGLGASSHWVYRFRQDQKSRKEVQEAIVSRRGSYEAVSASCTADVMHAALADFTTTSEITADAANVVFLITDGSSSQCSGDLCGLKTLYDAAGIKLYVVGIGSRFYSDQVQCVVDELDDITTIRDFSDDIFFQTESEWREKVCPSAQRYGYLNPVRDDSEMKHWTVMATVKDWFGLSTGRKQKSSLDGNSLIKRLNIHQSLM